MIKLIASDLDGTLLMAGEKSISETTKTAIMSVFSSGRSFAVISGRDTLSLKKLFHFAGDSPYYIGCSGAVCIKDGRVLYSRPIPDSAVIKALQYAKTSGKNVVFSAADAMYICGSCDFQKRISSMYGDGEVEAVKVTPDIKKPIYKISFFTAPGETKPDFSDFGVRLSYDKNGWTEFVNRFANKGGALTALQSRIGALKSNTASLGDSGDDADMFRYSALAFSFGDCASESFPEAIRTESFMAAYKIIMEK